MNTLRYEGRTVNDVFTNIGQMSEILRVVETRLDGDRLSVSVDICGTLKTSEESCSTAVTPNTISNQESSRRFVLVEHFLPAV